MCLRYDLVATVSTAYNTDATTDATTTPSDGENGSSTVDSSVIYRSDVTSGGKEVQSGWSQLCNIEPWLLSFLVWLGYINSFLNPVIYTIFNAEFRRAFKKILRRRFVNPVLCRGGTTNHRAGCPSFYGDRHAAADDNGT
jgi:hypothetical protein